MYPFFSKRLGLVWGPHSLFNR